MSTITITKKEYNALVFAKNLPAKKAPQKNKFSWEAGFGVFKKAFGKNSSVTAVNKLRKSWRA